MYSTRQQDLQYRGLASQIINDDKTLLLRCCIQTSIKLTQRALLVRYNNTSQISALTLLTHKSESLQLHSAVLNAEIDNTERNILLSYINQNIETIDEAIHWVPQ